MATKKFTPTEYPEDAASQALAKADALVHVLQAYMTSDRWDEAPVLDHRLHWFLEALADDIAIARQHTEIHEMRRFASLPGAANG